MANTIAAAHEHINYLDSILHEEESRCEYSHEWRRYSISRSGRFKSKNKKRDAVDLNLFDSNGTTEIHMQQEQDKIARKTVNTNKDNHQKQQQQQQSKNTKSYDREEHYTSFFETNL